MRILKPRSDPAYDALNSGRYLTALEHLEAGTETSDWARTLRLWALNSVDPWNAAWEIAGSGEPFDLLGEKLHPPEDSIGRAMRSHRAVVLMEVHRAPETTRFGARLLPLLRAAGATHFAFETGLQGPLDRFQSSGVFRADTVTYGFDPSRACMLRTARDLGLKLLAFDFPSEGTLKFAFRLLRGGYRGLNRRREEFMAENLARLIFEPDPEARAVVWTGEQHAMTGNPADIGWRHPFMAANLGRLLGEEPFCVGQHVIASEWLATPHLLGGSHPWAAARGLDVVVLHHRGGHPMMPAWLGEELSPVLAEPHGAALVQLLPADEGAEAVPADQRLTHNAPQRLFVKPGRYVLRGIGTGDQEIWRRPVSV